MMRIQAVMAQKERELISERTKVGAGGKCWAIGRNGAGTQNRTVDLLITNQLLYR
jgi:hypothetical protein